jgi:putative hydrolase of the HAD superfamily
LEVFSPEALDDFLYVHAQLVRRVQLMAGAGESLQALGASAAMLGLCSNCQPYTLRELAAALAPAGLALTAFDPELCFFSFQAGFSKPDPMAFRQLGHILAGRGVTGEEILFVGDRLDNDIYPARAEGWRTWHLSATSSEGMGGDWNAFLKFIRAAGLLQAQA